MAPALRVIPCLDVDGGRVVKGVNFENLRDAGDPVELARRYDAEGADELTFLDVSASVEKRETTFDVVRRTAEEVFVPLTVGGGVRSGDDVDRLLAEVKRRAQSRGSPRFEFVDNTQPVERFQCAGPQQHRAGGSLQVGTTLGHAHAGTVPVGVQRHRSTDGTGTDDQDVDSVQCRRTGVPGFHHVFVFSSSGPSRSGRLSASSRRIPGTMCALIEPGTLTNPSTQLRART